MNNKKFVEKWYEDIRLMLSDDATRERFMSTDNQDDLTKLRRMNENVGFFRDGKMVPRSEI